MNISNSRIKYLIWNCPKQRITLNHIFVLYVILSCNAIILISNIGQSLVRHILRLYLKRSEFKSF